MLVRRTADKHSTQLFGWSQCSQPATRKATMLQPDSMRVKTRLSYGDLQRTLAEPRGRPMTRAVLDIRTLVSLADVVRLRVGDKEHQRDFSCPSRTVQVL